MCFNTGLVLVSFSLYWFHLLHLLWVPCDGTSVAYIHWHCEDQLSKSPQDQMQGLHYSTNYNSIPIGQIYGSAIPNCMVQIPWSLHSHEPTNKKHAQKHTFCTSGNYTVEVWKDTSINQLRNNISNQVLKWNNNIWHGRSPEEMRRTRTYSATTMNSWQPQNKELALGTRTHMPTIQK